MPWLPRCPLRAEATRANAGTAGPRFTWSSSTRQVQLGTAPVVVLVRTQVLMELPAPDEETMVRAAVADLDQRFASIDRPRIESTVRRLIGEWLAQSRVKTFVGIIAERHARTELRKFGRESSAGDAPRPAG